MDLENLTWTILTGETTNFGTLKLNERATVLVLASGKEEKYVLCTQIVALSHIKIEYTRTDN